LRRLLELTPSSSPAVDHDQLDFAQPDRMKTARTA